ncbi:hypothetical protein GN244_ATG17358 [Phytophthora infestans]|uniref:Uncharacterized protein n=1 Tax=Phytophthora infestans TaxID=4787 RepID=A0A833WL95_PHYIN|nr:hypothetical protein GN244_ATG17358 [Phytophthora infestans]
MDATATNGILVPREGEVEVVAHSPRVNVEEGRTSMAGSHAAGATTTTGGVVEARSEGDKELAKLEKARGKDVAGKTAEMGISDRPFTRAAKRRLEATQQQQQVALQTGVSAAEDEYEGRTERTTGDSARQQITALHEAEKPGSGASPASDGEVREEQSQRDGGDGQHGR